MDSNAISPLPAEDSAFYARGREAFIRLSLLALMVISCALLLRPFLNIIICGIIISVAIYPAHRMLTSLLRGRAKLSAALCSAMLLAVLILPSIMLATTLVEGIQAVTHQVQAGRLDIPPPPPGLQKIPIAGPRLQELWILSSTNLPEALKPLRPQIEKSLPAVLSVSAGIAGTIFQFFIAIILTGFLLATSQRFVRVADRIFARIFGDRGPEFKDLVGATIRTVTNGVLGVALIQTLFACLGFWVAGLPALGLWALVFLISAVLQVGGLVLLPAVLYGFAVLPTSHAIAFLVWCIIVGLLDNVLKPILLGRGAKVPMLVILIGVLGGFIAMNSLIGLFVGAVVLSVGYKLIVAWLGAEASAAQEPDQQRPVLQRVS